MSPDMYQYHTCTFSQLGLSEHWVDPANPNLYHLISIGEMVINQWMRGYFQTNLCSRSWVISVVSSKFQMHKSCGNPMSETSRNNEHVCHVFLVSPSGWFMKLAPHKLQYAWCIGWSMSKSFLHSTNPSQSLRSNVSGVARVVAAIGGYMTLTMGLMLIDWIRTSCGKVREDETRMLWGYPSH